VRRIAEKLDLDAKAILAPLVEQTDERDRAVIPSWQRRPASLQSVHLYVGYAALMTGALGGLIWLSNEAANENQALEPAVQVQPTTTVPLTPDTSARQASAISAPEMGPPEGF
jgi:cytoskeleton protein RodZ